MNRLRAMATIVCSSLCLFAICAGSLLSYVSRVVFRPNAFADRVAASLAEPGVADYVASRFTDELLQQRRDLTAFRPIILGTTEAIISSAPFRAVVRRTAKVAHQTMISKTGEEISLSISDAGLILQSALSVNPELAKKIPAKATGFLVSTKEAPGSKIIIHLLRYARDLRIGALSLFLFGISMGTLGFLLAYNRRRFLFRMGILLAVIAMIFRLIVRFGGNLIARRVQDELIGNALAGVWHAFLGGFLIWTTVLAVIGLVIAAGVASIFGRFELQKIRDSIQTWLARNHERKWMHLLHSILLVGAGMLAILSPSFVLTAVAMICGLVVVFVGLRELFDLILLLIPQKEMMEPGIGVSRIAVGRLVTVTLLALMMAAAALLYLRHTAKSAETSVPIIDKCNGDSELCGRRLNEVVLPATHNSMSAADIPNWMFPEQETSIPLQLQDGVRGFLIDAHYGVPAGERVKTLLDDEVAARKKYEEALGTEGVDAAMRIRDRLVGEQEGSRGVYLCHGFCELGASSLIPILQKMREFLVLNPNEVMVLVIQDEGVTPQDIAKCFQQSGLIDFVYRRPLGPPWPTLRQMIEGDQRVLVFAENNSAGVPWYHLAYESMQETPYKFHKPDEFSCRPNRGNPNNSLFLINHWIETAPAPRPSNAEIVNAYDFLLRRAKQCEKERHMLPNLIAVDFYKSGDLFKVVEALNRESK